MHRSNKPIVPREQFLGELESELACREYYHAEIRPGQYVHLQREPENPFDPNAIRVDKGRFQPVGYVSPSTATWLTPLLDGGKIRVEGYIAARCRPAETADTTKLPLVLMVFLQASGRGILDTKKRRGESDANHRLALEAFRKAQTFDNAELLRDYVESLEPLRRQDLLPQTRLLLALIPSMVSELRAAKGMQTLAALQAVLNRLSIGEAIHHGGLTLHPLSWPSDSEPPYLLFSQAIERNLAAAEDVREGRSAHRLRLYNQSDRPILIPEGEILVCGKRNQMVNATILAAPRSAVTLPAEPTQPERPRHASSPSTAVAGTAIPVSPVGLPRGCAGVATSSATGMIGVDLFDCSNTFQALWGRLARARLSVVWPQEHAAPSGADATGVRRFFQSVASHARVRASACGLSEKLEIDGPGLSGSALLYADRLCHLAAFHFEEHGAR